MYKPPRDPRDRPLIEQPTWQRVFVSYAMIAVIFLLIWGVSQPRAGVVVLAAIVGLFIGGRRAYRLTRHFYDCREFTFELGGKIKITVTQLPTGDAK